MSADAGGETALDLAVRRLERAMALLEQRLAQRIVEASATSSGAFEEDRARLASALDQARAREHDLAEAGAAASEALARAIAEIREALDAGTGAAPTPAAREA